MFDKPSNYFFAIFFDWNNILKLLGIPDSELNNFEIDKDSFLSTFGTLSFEILGIDRESAIFEYYILPNSIKNPPYSYSTIYDQQLKRFSENGKVTYMGLLKNKTSQKYNGEISCHFSKFSDSKNQAEFRFIHSKDFEYTSLTFYFDDKYLNLKKPKDIWGPPIPYEARLSTFTDNPLENDKVQEKIISVNSEVLSIVTTIQSQHD